MPEILFCALGKVPAVSLSKSAIMARRTRGTTGSDTRKSSAKDGHGHGQPARDRSAASASGRPAIAMSLLVSLLALVVDTLAVFGRVPRFNFLDWDDNINIYAN